MHIVIVALVSFFVFTMARYLLPIVIPERLAILAPARTGLHHRVLIAGHCPAPFAHRPE